MIATTLERPAPIVAPARRPFKRVGGCLCVADAGTPALDQRYGYKLEPVDGAR